MIFDQIAINLISNSIKYKPSFTTHIHFSCHEDDQFYYFEISDNGPGIDQQYHDKIFKIFEKISERDKYGERGNGIGLATVKKIIQKLVATLPSILAMKWVRFEFHLKK